MDEFIKTCELKQSGQIDDTWNDIALKFGLPSGNSAKKRWYRIRDKIASKNDGLNQLNEYSLTKLRDERRELRNLLKEKARIESFREYIMEVAKDISKDKPLLVNSTPKCKHSSQKDGILMLSDWHSELEVDNFKNQFNKDIFIKRIGKLIDKTIEYGTFNNINTLHVVNLGDLTNGIIHTTARIMNNEDIISQIMFVSELLAEILVKFANVFPNVRFYSVSDNHNRVMPNKKESLSRENFARIIPWYLESRLKDISNIGICTNCNIDHEIIYFSVYDFNILAVHGHRDNYNSIVSNLSLLTRTYPDYILSAHVHHNVEDEVHGIELIVNSSLVGTDDYALEHRYSSKPAQKLLIFNPQDGRECTYSINLKE